MKVSQGFLQEAKKLRVYRSKRVAWVLAKGWKGNATTHDTYSKRNLDRAKAVEKFIDGREKYLSSQIKSCLNAFLRLGQKTIKCCFPLSISVMSLITSGL